MRAIKIYGERNTGTNYLEQLLKRHIAFLSEEQKNSLSVVSTPALSLCKNNLEKAEVNCFGWKHRLIDSVFLERCCFDKEKGLILTLTKNPYAWLLSLHKRPYAPIHLRNRVIAWDEQGKALRHSDKNIKIIREVSKLGRIGRLFLAHFPQWSEYEEISFSDFVRARWFTQFNENYDQSIKNPVLLWNIKNQAYLDLAKSYNVLSFTYEELLASPKTIIQKVFNRLDFHLEDFENIDNASKAEDANIKNNEFYRDYYLNERWREKLNKKDLQWISSQLDVELMKAFNYSFLDQKIK